MLPTSARAAVCRSPRIPRLCRRTKWLKFGILPQVLRKILFIGPKRRTNQMMKSILLHFLARFFRGPALDRDAIGSDHHTCTIIAITAVDKDLLAVVLA